MVVLAISFDGLRLRYGRNVGAFPLVTLKKKSVLFSVFVLFLTWSSMALSVCDYGGTFAPVCLFGGLDVCGMTDNPFGSGCGSAFSATCYVGTCAQGNPGPDYSKLGGGLQPSPSPPSPNPRGAGPTTNPMPGALALAAALGSLAAFAVAGTILAAPLLTLAASVTAAGLLTGAALNLIYPSGAPPATVQDAITAAAPPLNVTIAPSPTAPPDPVPGATTTPSIATSPTGQFVPGGGPLSTSASPSGWSPGGAPGEWNYTPAPTAANPTPTPTAQITDQGYTVAQKLSTMNMSGTIGAGSPEAILLQRYNDQSVVITPSATIPVTTSGGNPTTVRAAVPIAYSPSGSLLPGSPPVAVETTLGNGSPSNGGTGLYLVNSGTGSGTITGPAGGCASGDCSTESTQLANKGILQGIKDALTSTGAPSVDPQARTGADISTGLHGAYDGPLAGLKGWQLPAHVSQCPSGTFTIPGSSHVFSMDGHCTFASQNLPFLSSIFLVLWSLAALMIVIRL